MHLRYLTLLVASSVAVTTLAQTAKNDLNSSSLRQLPSTTVHPMTSGLDTHLSPSATNEEESRISLTSLFLSRQKSPFENHLHVAETKNIKKLSKELKYQKSARDAYLVAGLDQVADSELLTKEAWKKWALFVIKMNKKQDPVAVVLDAMEQQLTVPRFLKILIKGSDDQNSEKIAKPLLFAKEQKWLWQNYTPLNALKDLEIDKHILSLFSNDLYNFWSTFVQTHHLSEPNGKTEYEWLQEAFPMDNEFLEVLTSDKNARSSNGWEMLVKYVNEQSDPTTFYKQFMHSRSVLRIYFTKNPLPAPQQTKLMELTDPDGDFGIEHLKSWRNFKKTITLPKPDKILPALETSDLVWRIWFHYVTSIMIKYPTIAPVTNTVAALISNDITLIRTFVDALIERSFGPSKVFMMVQHSKANDAERVENVWKEFLNKYQEKKPTIIKKLQDFIKLSSKHSITEKDIEDMRAIVDFWAKSQANPEVELESLIFTADATRVLDHWVDCIDYFLNMMPVEKMVSQSKPTDVYLNMLRMLIVIRDLGHFSSRNTLKKHELIWTKHFKSAESIFTVLKLDDACKKKLMLAKEEMSKAQSNHQMKLVKQLQKPPMVRAGPHVSSPRLSQHGNPGPRSSSKSPSVLDSNIGIYYYQAMSQLLENPLLHFYRECELELNNVHHTHTTLFDTLLDVFEGKDLVEMIIAMDQYSKTVEVENLKNQMFNYFMTQRITSAQIAFEQEADLTLLVAYRDYCSKKTTKPPPRSI
ncbi:hypothetical protein Plhal710r2_c021g0088971 [Plasmopara halstedii]